MVVAQSSGEWTPEALIFLAVVGIGTVVAAVAAAQRARRMARRDGSPSTTSAAVALTIVRAVLFVAVVYAPFTLIPGASLDRAIDDRVEIEDFGYSVPGDEPGEIEVFEGPWLVLRPQANVRMCSQLGVHEAVDPDPLHLGNDAGCATRKDLVAEYGEVELTGGRVEKRITHPPSGVGTRLDLLRAGAYALLLLAGFALERILRLTALRRPFASRTVLWLRVLALALAGALVVVPALQERFVAGLMREYFGSGRGLVVEDGWVVSGTGCFVVLLLLALAEVWRFGVRLQREADVTV